MKVKGTGAHITCITAKKGGGTTEMFLDEADIQALVVLVCILEEILQSLHSSVPEEGYLCPQACK